MYRTALLLLLGCSADAMAAGRQPDLSDACVDGRAMLHSVRVTPTLVTIATADGAYRIDLAEHCAIAPGADVVLLAPDGWACGGPREYLRSDGRVCRVERVQPIAFTEYTRLSRDAAAGGAMPGLAVLEPVEVIGRKSALRGFGGTSEYCFNPRFVRGWSEKGNAIEVETSPRRAGGNRRYRVELGPACTDLAGALSLDFRSGVGIGLICANAGDRVVVLESITGGDDRFYGQLRSRLGDVGCDIMAVYPVRG
jgi:hypothetical protein